MVLSDDLSTILMQRGLQAYDTHAGNMNGILATSVAALNVVQNTTIQSNAQTSDDAQQLASLQTATRAPGGYPGNSNASTT